MNKKDFETVAKLDMTTKKLQAKIHKNMRACQKIVGVNEERIKSAFNQAFQEIYGENVSGTLTSEYNEYRQEHYVLFEAVTKNHFKSLYLDVFFNTDGFYVEVKSEQKLIARVNEILRGE